MFVIVEGSDASGKSSLTKCIAEKLGPETEMFHKGRPGELSRGWVLNEYVLSIESRSWDVVHGVADRWHWGEVTYAPLKRPETDRDGYGLLGVAGWRWTEMFLASRGVAQFWLYQPTDVVISRILTRGDDFVSVDELDTIISLYGYASANTLCLTWVLEPDNDLSAIDELAEQVITKAAAVYDEARFLSRFPEYIGVPKPDVLLIGDKRNDPSNRTRLPFLPIDNNSGEYLMTALPPTLWRNVGIINAGDIYGPRLLELYEALGRPMIVCLGRMAEREVRSSGLYVHEYAVLPHPQYVRRFHHRDKFQYGSAIQAFGLRERDSSERYGHWILP